MSIQELNTACLARRVRLARERFIATAATMAVFTFVIVVAFGGLKF